MKVVSTSISDFRLSLDTYPPLLRRAVFFGLNCAPSGYIISVEVSRSLISDFETGNVLGGVIQLIPHKVLRKC